MKALVTGGSGFIGSHVVDKLRDKGVAVRVFDMIPFTYRNDIEFYQGSILDLNALRMALAGVDIVFHLGAIADVKDVYQEPHYSENINVRGTINVLEAARLNGGIKRFVYGSTTWVYSETNGAIVDENTPLKSPSHLYTATKLAGEYYCNAYSKLYNLVVTILRYGIPYGPRARDGSVVSIFVKHALTGEVLTIAGDGSQYRRFVYVEDLAEGNVLSLQKIGGGKIYNLEGDERITIKQLVESIRSILGDVRVKYVEARPGDFSGKEIENRLAKSELSWSARTRFTDGLRKYIDWYREKEGQRKAQWEKLDEFLR